MTRWLITLAGSPDDLDTLVDWSVGDDWQIVRHDKHGVVLCGQRFEGLDDYEAVGGEAEALLTSINAAARFVRPDFHGVTRGMMRDQSGPRGRQIVSVGLAVETNTALGVSWVKRAPDGTIVETSDERIRQQQARDFHRLVILREAHPDLADALRYLEEEPDLRGYYKVGEAILRALGKPKKWKTFDKLGWTSNEEVWRFTGSTHTRRHHAQAGPDRPMTDDEARAFVRDLLNKLIGHLQRTTR